MLKILQVKKISKKKPIFTSVLTVYICKRKIQEKMRTTLLTILCLFHFLSNAQVKNYYSVSLSNALHHEAEIQASFSNIQPGKVVVEIAKHSPARFGTYNFVKNIYNLKFTDFSGEELKVNAVGLDTWEIERHQGQVRVSYTLFGDSGNETFTQINQDFALFNHPASFVYIPTLANRPIELTFKLWDKPNWSTVNQLKPSKNKKHTFESSNLQEFMDSPTLLGEIATNEKTIESGSKDYLLALSAISKIDSARLESLLDETNKVSEEYKNIFGGYPNFEHKKYNIILGLNQNFGNINEGHKNSLLFTSEKADLNNEKIIKNVAASFFKSWNGTRICPVALKPFDYKKLATVKEYWFTEGFAEYYALLGMCRAKIISQERFLREIAYSLSDVRKSPALSYQNTVEMSEKISLFKGLSKYSDPQNLNNTVIPVEKHGLVIALVLDLSLRDKEKSLDGFMRLLWAKYGKIDQAFSIENFYSSLREYAGETFTENFFNDYIYGNASFEIDKLLEDFGISTTPVEVPYIGAIISFDENDSAIISEYTAKNTPAYESGLEKGDVIISIDSASFSNALQYKNVVSGYKIGKKITILYNRNGEEKTAIVKLQSQPNIILSNMLKTGAKVSEKNRLWLGE